jgi:hypothetical protein
MSSLANLFFSCDLLLLGWLLEICGKERPSNASGVERKGIPILMNVFLKTISEKAQLKLFKRLHFVI